MLSEALEFLWHSVLPVPELEFLLYCDDGHWKLKERCKQNYSSWARNHGIRLPAKTESIDNVLNNTKLLCMDTPASHEGEVPLASTSRKSVIKNLFLTSAPIEAQSTAKPNTSGLSTRNPTPMSAGTHMDGMYTNGALNATTFTQATVQPSTIPNHATTGSLNMITQPFKKELHAAQSAAVCLHYASISYADNVSQQRKAAKLAAKTGIASSLG
ncbi:hypothetical protein V8E53_007429 [Lactarius tabidus]